LCSAEEDKVGGEGTAIALSVLKKAASLALTLWLMLSLVFVIVFIVSDLDVPLVPPPYDGGERMRTIIDRYHLDDSIIEQYAHYLWRTLQGDFGISVSYMSMTEISDVIWTRASHTLLLLIPTLAISILLGTAIAWLASTRKGDRVPLMIHGLSLLALSAAPFALGLTLQLINYSYDLGLPIHGNGLMGIERDMYSSPFVSALMHAIMPFVACFLPSLGLFILLARACIRGDPSLRMHGPGLRTGGWLAAFIHQLTNMRPFLYFYAATVLGTVLVVDAVFSYSGLGGLLWNAAMHIDFGLQLACFTFIALMALAVNLCLGTILHAANRSNLRKVTNDWMTRDEIPDQPQHQPKYTAQPVNEFMSDICRRFVKSKVAVCALAIIVVLTLIGMLAPLLATVPNPTDYTNYEPQVLEDGWTLPRQPSFDRSPYTDFMHPLGTDSIGRDVYSLWLYSAREEMIIALAIVVITTILGSLIGLVAASVRTMGGPRSRITDFLLTTVARGFVSIPMIVLLISLLISMRLGNHGVTRLIVMFFLVCAFYTWAWILVAKPVRMRMADTDAWGGKLGSRRIVIAESLAVAKFAVPLIILCQSTLEMLGLTVFSPTATWGQLLEFSFSFAAFQEGLWFLILPPMIGLMLLVTSTFAVLDRLEWTIRSSECARSTTEPSGIAPSDDAVSDA